MIRALISLLMAIVMILGSDACSCLDQGDHYRLCNAGFVAVLRITSEGLHPTSGTPIEQWLAEQEAENGFSRFYYGDVKFAFELAQPKPLRDEDKLLTGAKYIYSSADSGTCGYRFSKGDEYVVFGYYSEYSKQLRTSACSGNFPLEGEYYVNRHDQLTKYSCEGEIPDLSQRIIELPPALVMAKSESDEK